jgi:protein-disulfide isomerase-like protein with CxxC motif
LFVWLLTCDFLRLVTDVNYITFATAGGSQTVTKSTVTLMTRISDAFYVEGEGSTLLLEQVTIERNQIQADPWSAVAARTNAVAQVSNITIAENTGVEFGVVSFNSMVTVQDTIIRQNIGSVSTSSEPMI